MRKVIKILGVGLLVVGFGVLGMGLGRLDWEGGLVGEGRAGRDGRIDQMESVGVVAPSPCVPTFLDGGGPYYEANAPVRENIAPNPNGGEKLVVRGRIWDGNCRQGLGGVVLDVWQASEEGEYEENWYRGRVVTDEDGSFVFETVIPEGYGEGTAYRPPHIHFKVWSGGRLLVTSQMFFPDVEGRAGFDDAFIVDIEETSDGWEAWHDIVVGGV